MFQSRLKGRGLAVSRITLRRRLKETGFKDSRPAKKPRLNAQLKRARLDWPNQVKKFACQTNFILKFSEKKACRAFRPVDERKLGRVKNQTSIKKL